MIIFGPIPSRRLGRSLGINNIPPKVCSYSCIYCQIGATDSMSITRQEFFSSDDIFYKVEKVVHGNKEWLPFEDDNWVTDENPGFVNEDEMIFELKEDAKAFEEIPGFEPIPFNKIGVKK